MYVHEAMAHAENPGPLPDRAKIRVIETLADAVKRLRPELEGMQDLAQRNRAEIERLELRDTAAQAVAAAWIADALYGKDGTMSEELRDALNALLRTYSGPAAPEET